jgi:hypothetical protein
MRAFFRKATFADFANVGIFPQSAEVIQVSFHLSPSHSSGFIPADKVKEMSQSFAGSSNNSPDHIGTAVGDVLLALLTFFHDFSFGGFSYHFHHSWPQEHLKTIILPSARNAT